MWTQERIEHKSSLVSPIQMANYHHLNFWQLKLWRWDQTASRRDGSRIKREHGAVGGKENTADNVQRAFDSDIMNGCWGGSFGVNELAKPTQVWDQIGGTSGYQGQKKREQVAVFIIISKFENKVHFYTKTIRQIWLLKIIDCLMRETRIYGWVNSYLMIVVIQDGCCCVIHFKWRSNHFIWR